MNKEEEIRKLLEYLSSKWYHKVSKRGDGVFILEEGVLLRPQENSNERYDGWSFTVDFNEKTISMYSYCESHHNGDHYGTKTVSLKWDQLMTGYGSLREVAKDYALKEAEQKIKDDMAEKRLTEILEGN